MSQKERIFIISILSGVVILTLFDIVSDLREGGSGWHVSIEGIIALIALIGIFILLKGTFTLRHDLETERKFSKELEMESQKWKQKSKTFIEGLSQTIDDQLSFWKLSVSEKEIAFLLLKGLSLKEIAEIRGTAEKTVRSQSANIYNKAGLGNRSELAAFFLEDLLIPQQKLDLEKI